MAVTDRSIYDEIAQDLVRYATVLVGPDHAWDVVSAAVARALGRTGGLTGLESPKTYLMRVVFKEATGVNRRRSQLLTHPETAADSGLPEVDVEVGNVDDLVIELPALQRAVYYLVIFLDYSPAGAAELIGKRLGKVRRYLRQARKNLADLGDDRSKEVFRRMVADIPDAPAFSTIENGEIAARAPIRFKPWMLATGAALLALIVVGGFGLFGGGGGPDLAAPDEDTVGYVKLGYSGSAAPRCLNREVVDNFGHNEATIEIWGPSSDDLTLMVATFPDGSTERTVIKGDLENPVRGWGRDITDYPDNTSFRVIGCEGNDSEELTILEGFDRSDRGTIPWAWFLSPPPGDGGTWDDVFGEALPAELDGTPVLLYQLRRHTADEIIELDLYVAEDTEALLRQYTRITYPGMGSAVIDVKVVEKSQVPADSISFDTAGLVAFDFSRGFEWDRENCPVTIPSQGFTPPDSHPATPSGDRVWFGKDELWTVLSNDGSYDGLGRSVWWSSNFTDPGIETLPAITVTYTLLNSTTPLTIVIDQGTNASSAEEGLFIIAGSGPDIEGCWQVTAVYKNASLSYVYYNPEGQDPATATPTVVVPDVVGMTVELAQDVLQDVGIEGSVSLGVQQTDVVCSQDPAPGTNMTTRPLLVKLGAAPEGECPEPMDATTTGERCLEYQYLPPPEETTQTCDRLLAAPYQTLRRALQFSKS